MERASSAMMPDGKRLHLHHGPIDLIISAYGPEGEVDAAYTAAFRRFETVLEELADELSLLREEVTERRLGVNGEIARTMELAVKPYYKYRVTPMAAVAGAVAQHVLEAMTSASYLTRAYVNNGGDIAIHLTGDESFVVAAPSGKVTVKAEDHVGGIATSGWRGRSFSLGIADAVTVLAATASEADVIATLIANAVDLPYSPKIMRRPASDLAPDSDLKDRLVTVSVDALEEEEVLEALGNGVVAVQRLLRERQFEAVSLMLNSEVISLKCSPHLPDETDVAIDIAQIGYGN